MNKLTIIFILVCFLCAPIGSSATPAAPNASDSVKKLENKLSILEKKLAESNKEISDKSTELKSIKVQLENLEAKLKAQNKSIDSLVASESKKESLLTLASRNEREVSQLVNLAKENKVTLTDILTIVISVLLLFLSILAWQVNRRIAFLTGAMETHSDIMLRIEASKNKDIELKWWDPTIAGPCKKEWPTKPEHDTDATVKKLYVGLPLHLRKNPDNCWCGIKRFVSGIWKCFLSIIFFWRNTKEEKKPNKTPQPTPKSGAAEL